MAPRISASWTLENGSRDPSYLTVLDCTSVVLTLSGNDVSRETHILHLLKLWFYIFTVIITKLASFSLP